MRYKTTAKVYAVDLHERCGCWYGDHSYTKHLEDVVNVAWKHLDELPASKQELALNACWLHDVIEDCRVTYGALKNEFGQEIADVVYNVTNELGKTREERADKTYPKIASCMVSAFVKLCDRIANTEFSLSDQDSGMFEKYRKEYPKFRKELRAMNGDEVELKSLWDRLDSLYNLP